MAPERRDHGMLHMYVPNDQQHGDVTGSAETVYVSLNLGLEGVANNSIARHGEYLIITRS